MKYFYPAGGDGRFVNAALGDDKITIDTQTPIEKLVRAFAAKDLSQAMDCFAEDALFFTRTIQNHRCRAKQPFKRASSSLLAS